MESSGLFDLQVNGFAGVDFNDAAITAAQVDRALEAILRTGVSGLLPTLITGYETDLRQRLLALDAAIAASRFGPAMVPGYHLEGPFLNAGDGYRGCHPEQAMRDPDAALYDRIGEGLERPILLVTLAPERPGSVDAIRALRERGICVAIGHSGASLRQIREAADAGATISTHLGNGMPRILPRTDNALIGQLSETRLAACFIADGHHMTPDELGALLRIKGLDKSILVTDAVVAADAEPGRYRFADMEIVLDEKGVVRRPGQNNLAGSSLRLDAAVRNVVAWGLASPAEAIRMASDNPRRAVAEAARAHDVELPSGRVRWSADLRPLEVVF